MPIDHESLKARQGRIEPASNPVLNQPTPRDQRMGQGGGSIEFGIVRQIGGGQNAAEDDAGIEIMVTPAVERSEDDEESSSRMKSLDEKITTMRTWPGTVGRDYRPFLWQGPPTDETTYLPVTKIGARFYVMQLPKFDIAEAPPEADYTDCWPVQRDV